MKSLFNPRFATISGMILLAALSRLLPHPPNFAPITAIALFGGAYFSDKRLAFFIPILAMLLSDIVIGFHSTMPIVYGCFALITLIGFRLKENKSVSRIALASIAGSTLFFIITNFAVWAFSSLYPSSISGLIACYSAAIPFYDYSPFSSMLLNSFMGDAFFSAVFFGAFAIAEQKIPSLIHK